MDAVLEDPATAPISDAEKALFALVEKANNETGGGDELVGQADVDRALEAGWSQEAVYDALTVVALFNYYNSWVDAAGTPEMSREYYEMAGERLAAEGYAST